MKPDDPNLAVGQTLRLNCTLTRSVVKNSHINASSIVFTFRQKRRVPSQFVTAINRRVAVFTYPNVKIRHNEMTVCCAITDMTKEVDCQHLYVGCK